MASMTTPEEAIPIAFRAREAGACSVYCSAGNRIIKAMANELIPDVGHLGMVPQHVTYPPAIRPTKLGAKNPTSPRLRRTAWLFMGSEEAGQSNAIWRTLIVSCRRRKIDPWKYLVWIFEELPRIQVTAATFAQHTPAAYAEKLRPRQHAKRTA